MSALVVQGVCVCALVSVCRCVSLCERVECVLMCSVIWNTSMVLWTFKAHVWVNDCAPWNLFVVVVVFGVCLFLYPSCSCWQWKDTRVHLFFAVHFSCRIWFDDISVWYSCICSFLILSVELCGSSLEDCHLHGNRGNSVLWNLSCWRHHVTWCNLLLNVLAIFMVEEFYIYAVVHFFFKV